MKFYFFISVLLTSFNISNAQTTWRDIADRFAYSLADKVCPFSKTNPRFSFDIIERSNYKTTIDLTAKWEGVVSTIFDPYETFTISGYLTCNNDGSNCTFKEYFRSENVNKALSDNSGSIATLAAVIGGIAYIASSSDYNNKKSYSTSTYSGSHSTSYRYMAGKTGTMEIPYTTASGDGWIGGVFFRNKYVIRYYVTITDRKIENGEEKYEFYINRGEVGFGSSWVSYNQIKGLSDAEKQIKEKMDRLVGRYTKYISTAEFDKLYIKL